MSSQACGEPIDSAIYASCRLIGRKIVPIWDTVGLATVSGKEEIF
jgi:hypothetical protein